jgi:hypothetical protein
MLVSASPARDFLKKILKSLILDKYPHPPYDILDHGDFVTIYLDYRNKIVVGFGRPDGGITISQLVMRKSFLRYKLGLVFQDGNLVDLADPSFDPQKVIDEVLKIIDDNLYRLKYDL